MTELYPMPADLPVFSKHLQTISGYAVSGRYPGFDEPVTENEWQEAVTIANTILDWATTIIANA